jgi:ABC-type iron transport system FetAB ATPase subunit
MLAGVGKPIQSIDVSKSLPLLQIKHLTRSTFAPVTLDVEAGECLCIYGPSGAGKSQLLRAIAELDPSDGELYLDGVRSTDMKPSEWRRKVGLLPPESSWWLDTPGAHFHNGTPLALEHLGLTEATLDQPIARLSSGEKQRLALLRLLANRPRVLLLDEPTANLDPDNVGRVEAAIEAYRHQQDAAVLWVTHDRQQAIRVASRCLQFENGKVAELAVEALT